MPEALPPRSQQSYRHEAFLWSDAREYTSFLTPFIEEGIAAGEPVMVAVIRPHATWLRDSLGASSGKVKFVDMARLGHNPARIIPGWQQFLTAHAADGRPARGIGEPIWSGRRPEELIECQLHEALLNVAVDPSTPFWLVCPYTVRGLDAAVIAEAYRSHPAVIQGDQYQGNMHYAGRSHVDWITVTRASDGIHAAHVDVLQRPRRRRSGHPGRLHSRVLVRQGDQPRVRRAAPSRGQPPARGCSGDGQAVGYAAGTDLRSVRRHHYYRCDDRATATDG
jgi:DcmR-like sensory protein